jgi:hypothetical protein
VKAGTEIVLVDGRGCWKLHVVTAADQRTAREFRLAGWNWRGLAFAATDQVDAQSRPVFVAEQPAIGRPGTRFHPLFLPAGWKAPSTRSSEVRRISEQSPLQETREL